MELHAVSHVKKKVEEATILCLGRSRRHFKNIHHKLSEINYKDGHLREEAVKDSKEWKARCIPGQLTVCDQRNQNVGAGK